MAAAKAAEFAEELASDVRYWSSDLPIILKGEQRQGHVFGYKLGMCAGAQRKQFIDEALDILRGATETGNPAVLGGSLSGIQAEAPQLVADVLDQIASDGELRRHLIHLTCCIELAKEDIDRVLALVNTSAIPVSTLRAFAYGRVLDHLPCATVASFCDAMLCHGADGIWAALEVLSMYCYGDDTKWDEAQTELRAILMRKPLSSRGDAQRSEDDYEWQQAAERLLRPGNDPDLATLITDDIIAACASDFLTAYAARDVMEPVLDILLTHYQQQVWSALGAALLNRNEEARLNLLDLLRGSLREIDAPRLVAALPEDYLKALCEDNGPDARTVVAYLIPPLAESGGQFLLSPVAQCVFR